MLLRREQAISSWLKYCSIFRNFGGSITNDVTGSFYLLDAFSCIVAFRVDIASNIT